MSGLSSIAIKCCDLAAQRGFYEALTGSEFQEVDVGVSGLKLVSGREEQDFEDYPIHQLGLRVEDIEALVKVAQLAGGRAEGELARDEGGQVVAGCVRDPDGNTIELQRA